MDRFLSKTDFLKWSICPDSFWLFKNDRETFDALDADRDPSAEESMEATEEIKTAAEGLFPEGINVAGVSPDKLFEKIQNYSTIFKPTIINTGKQTLVSPDILNWNPTKNTWDLYEVKGTSSMDKKPKIERCANDIAFQYETLTGAGWPMGEAYVIYFNKQFRRDGKIDPRELFVIQKMTMEVLSRTETIKSSIDSAKTKMDQTERPKTCDCINKPKTKRCDCFLYFHGRKIETENGTTYEPYDIFKITLKVKPEKKLAPYQELLDSGVTKISNIPEEFINGESKKAYTQWKANVEGEHFDSNAIKEKLAAYKYPLYFLDYETLAMTAIPLWDGLGPFHKTVFQYSLHIVESEADLLKGNFAHKEYLHEEDSLPSLEIIRHLMADIPDDDGSVVVWNKSFEMSRHKDLAKEHLEYENFLLGLNKRVVDLMEIFSQGLWVKAQFDGSASIKKVLPVLVPELTYSDLAIGDGMKASASWDSAIHNKVSYGETPQDVFDHLREYCGQDTVAMVRIMEAILKKLKE